MPMVVVYDTTDSSQRMFNPTGSVARLTMLERLGRAVWRSKLTTAGRAGVRAARSQLSPCGRYMVVYVGVQSAAARTGDALRTRMSSKTKEKFVTETMISR